MKENWDRIKREQEGREGVFHHVPDALPALLHARKVQQRAKAVGFEYPDVDGALADLQDELRELKADLGSAERRAEELGDVLFAAVNVARKLDVDPELELRRASERFRARVEAAETLARENGEDWSALPLERQDHYFDLAKEQLNEHDRRTSAPARSSTRGATRRSRSTCSSSRAPSGAQRCRRARRPACTKRSSCATAARRTAARRSRTRSRT